MTDLFSLKAPQLGEGLQEILIVDYKKRAGERVKFRWLDENGEESEYFFEIKIMEDEITKDVSLIITDFAEEDEVEDAKELWIAQLENLRRVIGG